MENVNGATAATIGRTVVRRTDGHVVESVQIDVTQSGDWQTESAFTHLAVDDVRASVGVSDAVVEDVDASRFEFSVRVGVIGVKWGPNDDVLQSVAIDVGDC